MSYPLLSLLLFCGSVLAGFLGALTGLGGGVVIIPLMTLVFGIDIHYAMGASLVSVIATSSGSAAAYVREGITNIRVGMFLEVATTLGAIAGAAAVGLISSHFIAVTFAIVIASSAFQSLQSADPSPVETSSGVLVSALRLSGSFVDRGTVRTYRATRVIPGFLLMGVAGILSGLLGIGSGAMKVIAMDRVMRLPFKVSTTTSNFMIGVTATASVGVYLRMGYVAPPLAMPVMLGVLLGSLSASRLLPASHSVTLRRVFAAVVFALALEMAINGLTGRI